VGVHDRKTGGAGGAGTVREHSDRAREARPDGQTSGREEEWLNCEGCGRPLLATRRDYPVELMMCDRCEAKFWQGQLEKE